MLLTENLNMNKKLIHWAACTLAHKNNHCNNCSLVMTHQRIVTVFSVALHKSPWQPFFWSPGSRELYTA